jgi:chemotaxis protein methyltransferase CheR
MEVNRGLRRELLEKYFTRENGHWVVCENVREMVRFHQFNVVNPWPAFPSMDVIFLRNVLIYFEKDARATILGRARKSLTPRGALFLGSAEKSCALGSGFERVQEGQACYYRLRTPKLTR